jgi:hypothetical protein
MRKTKRKISKPPQQESESDDFPTLAVVTTTEQVTKKPRVEKVSAKSRGPCEREETESPTLISQLSEVPPPCEPVLPLSLSSTHDCTIQSRMLKERKTTSAAIPNLDHNWTRRLVSRQVTHPDTKEQHFKKEVKTPTKEKAKTKKQSVPTKFVTWTHPVVGTEASTTMSIKPLRALHKWLGMATRLEIQLIPGKDGFVVFRLFKQKDGAEVLAATIVSQ